jgi:hypothetical protein
MSLQQAEHHAEQEAIVTMYAYMNGEVNRKAFTEALRRWDNLIHLIRAIEEGHEA